MLKFVYSIVDERSAQIAHEVYNGGVCIRFCCVFLSVASVCCVDVTSLLIGTLTDDSWHTGGRNHRSKLCSGKTFWTFVCWWWCDVRNLRVLSQVVVDALARDVASECAAEAEEEASQYREVSASLSLDQGNVLVVRFAINAYSVRTIMA